MGFSRAPYIKRDWDLKDIESRSESYQPIGYVQLQPNPGRQISNETTTDARFDHGLDYSDEHNITPLPITYPNSANTPDQWLIPDANGEFTPAVYGKVADDPRYCGC